MKKTIITGVFILVFFYFIQAQNKEKIGFELPEHKNKVRLSFKLLNNLIVIPIKINGAITLNFILDTGSPTPILTEKVFAELLQMKYARELVIRGPGIIDSVHAYVANDITLLLKEEVIGNNIDMLVLQEDYLELSKNLGEKVYGIIGADVFKNFVIHIDYFRKIITIYDPKKYKPQRKFIEFSMKIYQEKPYFSIFFADSLKKTSLDVLIDTGASHTALLDHKYADAFCTADSTLVTRLGKGISGEIPGFLCRIDSIIIDDFSFVNPIISVPFQGVYNKAIKRGANVGTIGGELLKRFIVVFDYPGEKIYLKKGLNYKKPFEYDMSGMNLKATGTQFDVLTVDYIKKGGPADKVGVKVDDEIFSINGRTLKNHKLSEINSLLSRKEGLKIRCVIIRNKKKYKKTFRLKRII